MPGDGLVTVAGRLRNPFQGEGTLRGETLPHESWNIPFSFEALPGFV